MLLLSLWTSCPFVPFSHFVEQNAECITHCYHLPPSTSLTRGSRFAHYAAARVTSLTPLRKKWNRTNNFGNCPIQLNFLLERRQTIKTNPLKLISIFNTDGWDKIDFLSTPEVKTCNTNWGGKAQLVDRPSSHQKVTGSIPGFPQIEWWPCWLWPAQPHTEWVGCHTVLRHNCALRLMRSSAS